MSNAAQRLADAATFEDPALHRMLDLLRRLPGQAERAWTDANAFELPQGFTDPSDVVMLGMGGSAIGGDVIATIAAQA